MDSTFKSDPGAIVADQLESIRLAVSRIPREDTDKLVELILGAKTVFIAAQGRSGLVARCFATRLAQIGISVHVPGYANCTRAHKGDILIAVSCSGDTRTTVELAKIARDVEATVVTVTCSPNSQLARLADYMIMIPSDDEDVRAKSSCIVGPNNNTLFEQAMLIYADAVICLLLEERGVDTSVISQRHANLE